jgi:hypothetical protein
VWDGVSRSQLQLPRTMANGEVSDILIFMARRLKRGRFVPRCDCWFQRL